MPNLNEEKTIDFFKSLSSSTKEIDFWNKKAIENI